MMQYIASVLPLLAFYHC